MNDGMKYITFQGRYYPEIIVFPNYINHDEMAGILDIRQILGAGFVSMKPDDDADELILEDYLPKCWGASVKLAIKSRGAEDTAVLRKLLTPSN